MSSSVTGTPFIVSPALMRSAYYENGVQPSVHAMDPYSGERSIGILIAPVANRKSPGVRSALSPVPSSRAKSPVRRRCWVPRAS